MGKIVIEGNQKRYELIDFMKGFSILTIVLMHMIQLYMENVPYAIYKGASLGGTGVHVFIFCSGFGLYLSFLKKPLKWFDFIKKRLWKIYVPYIIVVVITFIIMPSLYEGTDKFAALLSHCFFFKMFVPQYESSYGGQLWYVSTIFQFYFVFNILCWLKKKVKENVFLIFALGISCIWWIFTSFSGLAEERIWNSFFLQYLWEFALGMIVAELLQEGKNFSIAKIHLWMVMIVGIGTQMILALKGGAFRLFNDIPALFGYSALIIIIYSLNIKWFNKVILEIANISYEWYLLHILVFSLMFQLHPKSRIIEVVIAVGAVMLSLIVSYLYKRIVDKLMFSH